MEHRLQKRVRIAVGVDIYCQGRLVARGTIRNLSRDGMFVEYEEILCPLHRCVQVGFRARGKGSGTGQRMSAYVIHRSDKGMGLMFVTRSDIRHMVLCGLFDQGSPANRQPHTGPVSAGHKTGDA